MNKFRPGKDTITNVTDKYLSYGGEGYNYNDYPGHFRVKFESKDKETKEFFSSLAAIEFFESLDEECALWEGMELLDSKTMNPMYNGEGAMSRVFRTFEVKMSTNALADAMYAVLLTGARVIYSHHNVELGLDKKERSRYLAQVCIEIEEDKIEIFQDVIKAKSLDIPT